MERLVVALRKLSSTSFFDRSTASSTAFDIVRWWEARRIAFNLVLGVFGVLTCIALWACAVVADRYLGQPIGTSSSPIAEVVTIAAYAVAANIAYTGGWMIEILIRRVWGPVDDFGRIALLLGLLFSIVLTLAPVILVVGYIAIRFALHAGSNGGG